MIVLQDDCARGHGRLLAHALRECDAALCRTRLKSAQCLRVLHGCGVEIGDQHLLRQIVLRGAESARRDNAVRACVGNVERGAQALGVVADNGLIVGVQPHMGKMPRDMLCIRVHNAAHEQFRAHADDFNDHAILLWKKYRNFLAYFTIKVLYRKGNFMFFVENITAGYYYV